MGIEMRELIKGCYYSYVKLNTGEKYLYESYIGKDASIKEVFDHLNISGKREYSKLSVDGYTSPLFYKHTGDISLIQLHQIRDKALSEDAKIIIIHYPSGSGVMG
jgi:hypothetical protein